MSSNFVDQCLLRKVSESESTIYSNVFFLSILIFGPPGNPRGLIVFVLLNFFLLGYPIYLVMILPATLHDLFIVHILFILFSFVKWFGYAHCSTVDPGYLNSNPEEYNYQMKQVPHLTPSLFRI